MLTFPHTTYKQVSDTKVSKTEILYIFVTTTWLTFAGSVKAGTSMFIKPVTDAPI